MNIENVKQLWMNPSHGDRDVDARLWDRAAKDYAKKSIPDITTNEFLSLLDQKELLTPNQEVLDIGCGTGRFSIAIANRVKSVTGVDVSENMIEIGKQKVEELGAKHVKLETRDWRELDIDALNFRGHFNLVFAHMTPAICDYNTFDKMNLCSNGYCAIVKSMRRHDKIRDTALSLVDVTPREGQDNEMIYMFSYLWLKGMNPEVSFREECWHFEKSIEDMKAWCLDQAKLTKTLTEQEEDIVSEYLEQVAVNGTISECVTTTVATMQLSRILYTFSTGINQFIQGKCISDGGNYSCFYKGRE